jgi:hypothetical protein
MKAQFQIALPDQVDFTLTMTMTLGDWKHLQKQLEGAYPAWRLSAAISSMVNLAAYRFAQTVGDEG